MILLVMGKESSYGNGGLIWNLKTGRLENQIKQMKESCKLIVRFLETKSYLYIQLIQFLQLITRLRILLIVNMQSREMTDNYGTTYLCLWICEKKSQVIIDCDCSF